MYGRGGRGFNPHRRGPMFGVAQWREHPVNGVQVASTIDTGGKVAGSSPAVNTY